VLVAIEVPEYVQAAARRALQWRADGHQGGQEAGVATARALLSGRISEDKAREIRAWFARHAAQPRGQGFSNTDSPTPRRLSFGLWGDPGDGSAIQWIERAVARLDREARGERAPARAERARAQPDEVRRHLRPPRDLADGSRVYDAVLAEAAVLPFERPDGGEDLVLRGPDALADLARSGLLRGLRVLRGPAHPPLDGGRFAPTRGEEIGAIVEARYLPDPGLLIGEVRVWRPEDQRRAEADLSGLSLGYYPEEIDETGEHEGQPYTRRVVGITPDHIITTDTPRGGDAVTLRTESTGGAPPAQEEGAMPEKLMIRGQEMDAAAIEAMMGDLEKAKMEACAEMDKMRAEMDKGKEDAAAEARGEAMALKARLEALESERAARLLADARADAARLGVRAESLASANDLPALQRAVVSHAFGADFAAAVGAGELPGAYKAALQTRAEAARNATAPTVGAPAPATRSTNPFIPARKP
jgi:hypothetical protein